ncbi:TadE/TadG family type IV pilus assembly protein [Sphingomonas lycopersici]|uniref:Pilus assembly protein TadG-related protein n=1 Tax=Sphingomonas lycopersici TaxID=2951807 RepID=A0AA42CR61_9SPHN|nr:pilus assembly protein TadG-related protein [Sphingomonas lycopersici]MCW6536390.1 pilus assembly protein TadG-related protein [Sphingomonas lycopersici]
MPIPSLLTGLRHFLSRLRRQRSGNVMMLFALAAIPMAFATGMGVDYARAAKLRTKMNALADAAALAAVTATMMNKDDATATQTATNMFNSQAALLSGVTYDPNSLVVTLSKPNGPGSRTVTVTYSALSQNVFGGILGTPAIAIGGSSTANNMTAPDIDFYLVLDNSPSMALPSTQAGINTMIANTPKQDSGNGCAFACHFLSTSATSGDAIGNPKDPATGKTMDNFALARSLKVVLRSDLVVEAAADLTDTATATKASNGAAYRMAIATFDANYQQVQTMTDQLATVKKVAQGITIPPMWANSYALASDGKSGVKNNDTNTSFTNMIAGINNNLATAGNGTRVNGDKPQAVIFIVTDGVRDEAVNGDINNRWIGQLERPSSQMPYAQSPFTMDPQVCENLKAKSNVRIAILYTSYLPLPKNAFYNSNVKPFQAQIASNLQACASPGLFTEVQTDGDISAALTQLFQAAVSTARLTN